MNCGRRGEDVFSDREDFEIFLAVLQEAALMFDARVAAYCLMSSHQGYISNAKKWDWLHKRFLLGMFSDRPFVAKKMYREFVTVEDSPEILFFFGKKNLASLFGSVDFIQWIKEKYYLEKKHDEVPESRILSPSIAEIKKVVCDAYGVDEQALLQTRRGLVNEPRVVSMYLGRKLSGLSLEEIGSAFGTRKYSSVGSVILRMERKLSNDKQLRKRVNNLRTKLSNC